AESRPAPAFTGSSNTKCDVAGVLSSGGIEIQAISEGVYTSPAFLQSLRTDGCSSTEVPEATICDAYLILRAVGYQSTTGHRYPVQHPCALYLFPREPAGIVSFGNAHYESRLTYVFTQRHTT
ncbi:hypothetical protein FOZ63_021523, partial [Perkinsus olseni]